MSLRTPNTFPSVGDLPYRLAIIASHPAELQGASYNLVSNSLQSNNAMTAGVFQGYISQFNPQGTKFDFDFTSFEVKDSLDKLREDLKVFQPNCVLYLGETCLQAQRIFHSIDTYRGSLFRDMFGYKALSTYAPKKVFTNWGWSPLFSFDFQRAVAQSYFPELRTPTRRLRAVMLPTDCIEALRSIVPGTLVSIDIEGGVPNPQATKPEYRFLNGVTCIGISTDPSEAFIIPLKDFDPTAKREVLKAFATIMCDPAYPKVLQNGLYDFFVLAWVWKLPIRNIAWDTMLSGWEIYPELPKGLGTLASLYTEEPYYKAERKIADDLTHYQYCCKDAAVTLEIAQRHQSLMSDDQKAHFNFNMSLLPALEFMMLKGIKYDKVASDARRADLLSQMAELQAACDLHAGHPVNINSPKQMCQTLYRDLGLPPQYAKEAGRNTTRETANADAMLKLIVKYGDGAPPFLLTALLWKKLEGARKQLEIDLDYDGRARCRYNVVGTETGRLSCQESNTGSGTNLQTIMESNRKFYIPDEGYYFFQCDLSGADGWTVAVHCAECGDPTMLDDYNYGLKPAKIIAAMSEHGEYINSLDRASLASFIKTHAIADETYAASKAVQHGCYTDGHEVLTPEGWINISDPRLHNLLLPVVCYDPKTKESQFLLPTHSTSFEYTGKLHHFAGTAIDCEVTHDHKCLLETNNKFQELTVEQLYQRNSGKLPITSSYQSGTSAVPEARLVAAIHADGCFTDRGYVTFHFAKVRKVKRIKQLLNELNIHYTICQNTDQTYHIAITDPAWTTRLIEHHKTASAQMFCWTQQSLSDYIDEYPHWDGHFGDTGSVSVFSANYQHIEWIATFANLVNKGVTWQAPTISGFGSKIYKIQINNRTKANFDSLKTLNIRQATTQVYCLTVPTGYLVIRRNQKIFISGNSNYGMKPNRMSENILEKSFKKSDDHRIVWIPPKLCDRLQKLYFLRYPGVRQWQKKVENQIDATSILPSASGHTRTFFGRPRDPATYRLGYAQEPQINTTYATNLAMQSLWKDPDNRDHTGALIIQPLHSVHDALCGQFPIDKATWAAEKIKQYFSNPIRIGNTIITIPFEGGYGPSWYHTKPESCIGKI